MGRRTQLLVMLIFLIHFIVIIPAVVGLDSIGHVLRGCRVGSTVLALWWWVVIVAWLLLLVIWLLLLILPLVVRLLLLSLPLPLIVWLLLLLLLLLAPVCYRPTPARSTRIGATPRCTSRSLSFALSVLVEGKGLLQIVLYLALVLLEEADGVIHCRYSFTTQPAPRWMQKMAVT